MQPIIHGFLLALGLILPLGAQNVFVFNQGANQKKLTKALPVIVTAGLCDTTLIVLAILGVSLILMSLPILQLVIYIIGLAFLLAILGKMLGSVDKTGKYIIILNKVSSVIVLIVSCIIIKNIWHILAN